MWTGAGAGCCYWCETDLLDLLEAQRDRNLLTLAVSQSHSPLCPPGEPTTVTLIFQLPGRPRAGVSCIFRNNDIA